ncbi:MAG: hypothetical protein KBH15_05330 [Candidatus Atribacteria bacterium]|nr:hypothetical protein [Candidatus Atribacteria bacterium]
MIAQRVNNVIVSFNRGLSDLEKLEVKEKLNRGNLSPYFLEDETGKTVLVTENKFPSLWLD